VRTSLLVAPLLALLLAGCASRGQEAEAVKGAVTRYTELLRDGYQRQNMNFMREVASEEQASRLYHHMAAMGEGNLRLSSTLGELTFQKVELPAPGEAKVSTREVWDFTHYRIATGEKYAEEKGFIHQMAYTLRNVDGKWLVTDVAVVSSQPTNTVIPWPQPERKGNAPPGAH
jgi:hypothetical protein